MLCKGTKKDHKGALFLPEVNLKGHDLGRESWIVMAYLPFVVQNKKCLKMKEKQALPMSLPCANIWLNMIDLKVWRDKLALNV